MRIESLHLEGVGPFENTTLQFPRGTRDDLADVYLLVGENGCGKTTAIHSIALALGQSAVLEIRAEGRLWPNGGMVKVATTGSAPSVSSVMRQVPSGLRADMGGVLFGGTVRPAEFAHWHEAFRSQVGTPELSWAVFGYSGQRNLGTGSVPAIGEDDSAPLAGSLSFAARTNDSANFAKWIAGQRFKMLKAREARQKDREASLAHSIEVIERAVREVIGRNFSFHFSVDDNDVRADLDGSVVDWLYLPEGLKAIVSWVGDLLMRMSRVRWANDLPIEQREFLLLLDEVDIHLHPAWQRKVLPMVQRLFPKAQIIASTHSPFVVASLRDGAVIELKIDEKTGRSVAQPPRPAPLWLSVPATLHSLFGIKSDFDAETEALLTKLQQASERVLAGDASGMTDFEKHEKDLLGRGEEVAQLVHYARGQLERRLPRPTGT